MTAFSPNLFLKSDAVFGLLFLCGLVFALVASLDPSNRDSVTAGFVILWSVVAAFFIGPAIYIAVRFSNLKKFKFVTKQNIVLGWTEDKYEINPSKAEAYIEEMILLFVKKLQLSEKDVRASLYGCMVLFGESTFFDSFGRKVAGIQDDLLIRVGWDADLGKTAFLHELGHRVLQVCAGDPTENAAHAVFEKIGLDTISVSDV